MIPEIETGFYSRECGVLGVCFHFLPHSTNDLPTIFWGLAFKGLNDFLIIEWSHFFWVEDSEYLCGFYICDIDFLLLDYCFKLLHVYPAVMVLISIF